MIEGVIKTKLKKIEDDKGNVMHMLKSDSNIFSKFGEVYFSIINPGKIKAWKIHKKMTLNCCVPHGKVKFVIYDPRDNSKTKGLIKEYILSPDDYYLITVPPMLWTGFTCLSPFKSILTNCSDLAHDPDEYEKIPEDCSSIPYSWHN